MGLLYQSGVDPSGYGSIDEALAAVRVAARPVEILVRDNSSVRDTAASRTVQDVFLGNRHDFHSRR
jgi:hypothetical protein